MADEQAAAQELRELIREAHGVLKDMRAERRAIEQLLDGIPAKVDARIEARLVAGLEELGEQTQKAMAASVAKVGKEFARLEAIYLGTDPQSRREGKPPLEDLVRAARSRGLTRGS